MKNLIKNTIIRHIEGDELAYFGTQEERITERLNELNPGKPTDGSSGFIAFNDGSKRIKIKTGRFIGRKLELNFTDRTIEKIGNVLNIEIFGECIEIRLDKGDKIVQNYRDSIGSDSCMAGSNADYTGLYAMNPDRFSMLVMIQNSNSARAIVSKLDNGEYYLDRIYSDSEELKDKMIDYAQNKGWYYRDKHTSRIYRKELTGIELHSDSILEITGLKYEDGKVPYMDSFDYGTIEDGLLNLSAVSGDINMNSTNGYIESQYSCSYCGEGLSDNDVYSGPDGETYCESCYDDLFSRCDRCEETYSIDDITYVESVQEDVCSHCLDRYFTQCADCNEYFLTDNMVENHNGEIICNHCYENDYSTCDNCGEIYPNDDCYLIEDECLCDNCTTVCECGKRIKENEDYCKECYEKLHCESE